MATTSYYRDRAICRKILAEGTGLMPERMTDEAIALRIRKHLDELLRHVSDAQLSSPHLVRALVELDLCWAEAHHRGGQLSLPV